jgi:Amt family ammonium transporter
METTPNIEIAQSASRSRTLAWSAIGLLLLGALVGAAATFFKAAPISDADLKAINPGDTAWVMVASALVMLMTPAVGFFYGGMVKSKNVVSVIKQSFLILALVSLQWVIVGYSLVFGTNISGVIGSFNFFGLTSVGLAPNATYAGTIPHFSFMMFQGMFAIITPALIIGSFAERIRFRTLVIFILLWTTLVYDPVAHWVWGDGGWLRQLGALDFAGGTVVHITAGFSGLAAAIVIGRRKTHHKGETLEGGNVPLNLTGVALLWFGWFGFNAGSALAANGLAASAFVVTNTAAAAAGLTWMILSWADTKKPSAMAMGTGAVCGLVAITPASGFVGPVASIAIGVIAGVVTYSLLLFRNRLTKIDDTLDVWAAHGMGGVVGAILTGVFAEKAINPLGNDGLLFGNAPLVLIQILAVVVSAGFAFVMTVIILKVMSFFTDLRVSPEDEETGLDLATHGEAGYRL